MSKGIIVVDTTENCLNCGCKLCFDRSYYCGEKARFLDDWEFDIRNERPDWCPIKEIPIRIEELKFPHSINDYQRKGFSSGWNVCINEMVK